MNLPAFTCPADYSLMRYICPGLVRAHPCAVRVFLTFSCRSNSLGCLLTLPTFHSFHFFSLDPEHDHLDIPTLFVLSPFDCYIRFRRASVFFLPLLTLFTSILFLVHSFLLVRYIYNQFSYTLAISPLAFLTSSCPGGTLPRSLIASTF